MVLRVVVNPFAAMDISSSLPLLVLNANEPSLPVSVDDSDDPCFNVTLASVIAA